MNIPVYQKAAESGLLHSRAEAALEMFGAFDCEVRRDLAGRDRFLVARKGMSCCV